MLGTSKTIINRIEQFRIACGGSADDFHIGMHRNATAYLAGKNVDTTPQSATAIIIEAISKTDAEIAIRFFADEGFRVDNDQLEPATAIPEVYVFRLSRVLDQR